MSFVSGPEFPQLAVAGLNLSTRTGRILCFSLPRLAGLACNALTLALHPDIAATHPTSVVAFVACSSFLANVHLKDDSQQYAGCANFALWFSSCMLIIPVCLLLAYRDSFGRFVLPVTVIASIALLLAIYWNRLVLTATSFVTSFVHRNRASFTWLKVKVEGVARWCGTSHSRLIIVCVPIAFIAFSACYFIFKVAYFFIYFIGCCVWLVSRFHVHLGKYLPVTHSAVLTAFSLAAYGASVLEQENYAPLAGDSNLLTGVAAQLVRVSRLSSRQRGLTGCLMLLPIAMVSTGSLVPGLTVILFLVNGVEWTIRQKLR